MKNLTLFRSIFIDCETLRLHEDDSSLARRLASGTKKKSAFSCSTFCKNSFKYSYNYMAAALRVETTQTFGTAFQRRFLDRFHVRIQAAEVETPDGLAVYSRWDNPGYTEEQPTQHVQTDVIKSSLPGELVGEPRAHLQ